jgi:predicted porin
MPRLVVTVFAVLVAAGGYSGATFADSAQDATNQAMQDQMKAMAKKIEELTKQVESLTKKPEKPAATAAAGPAAPAAPAASTEPKFDKWAGAFYGTLDVSFDDTTKGEGGMLAYHFDLIDPANPNSGYVQRGCPAACAPPKDSGPVGRVGYMPALSTNKSQIGYRGQHKIGSSDVNLIYQVETALAFTASPGLRTSQYQQASAVNGGVGLGDTFVGFAGKDWGRVKFGTFYSPYKKATDRLNPFSGMLGDYSVVIGNSGGDNRVEFGTRLDHSFAYESPSWSGFSFDLLYSPGQNRTFDNTVQSSGSPDCNGGNNPGSGNLLLNCDDGGFDNAFSAAVKFETGPLYVTAAYEIHKNVNRNSDGIGSNHPIYGFYFVPGANPGDPAVVCEPTLLDCGTYNALSAEFPTSFWVGATPPYLFDIGDETAFKVGAQYKLPFGLTVSAMWERLTRDIPANLTFQNERQRNGAWVALSWDFTQTDNLSAGWAHAGKTPGDPGGQHNYNPLQPDNSANMYTVAWKHKLDKQLYWYLDGAVTINKANAHYDIGAGGRGLTTDCHDGTHTQVIDYTSAGNTTWGGCRPEGVSTGLNFKF